MLKLDQLPGWNTLTEKEQERLKEVYGRKPKATNHMLSKKEMNKADKEKPNRG